MYKLHVKFESGGERKLNKTYDNVPTGKETFSCLPDTSVGQLKGKIGARFQVITSASKMF